MIDGGLLMSSEDNESERALATSAIRLRGGDDSLRVLVDQDLEDAASRTAAVVHDAGLERISCERVEPNLEDVFVTATQERIAERGARE